MSDRLKSTVETDQLLSFMNVVVNVRDYEQKEIPEEMIDQLFDAFAMGPSLANHQPWELLRIDELSKRKEVVAATLDPFLTPESLGSQQWLEHVPLLIVVTIEKRRSLARLGELGEIFSIQDTFSAIQNFRLLASYYSIGTSVVREFNSEVLKRNLNLPWYLEPIAVLAAGYSTSEAEIPPRLARTDFVHGGSWK
jgi:5,6-dimethylbenzimidazole synthase